jgi:hypothetical protein
MTHVMAPETEVSMLVPQLVMFGREVLINLSRRRTSILRT